MEKIIAAFDGLKYSESVAAHAMAIAKRYKTTLVGVFLEDFTYHSFGILDLVADNGSNKMRAVRLKKADEEIRDNSVKRFQEACENAGLEYIIHRNLNVAIRDLLNESLYADLLIIQNNESFSLYKQPVPTNFIVALLEKVECPVLLVPDQYKKPEQICFFFDGEPSSVFAIKQFSYLFRHENKPMEEITVVLKDAERTVPDSPLMQEWMQQHYAVVKYKLLEGDARQEIVSHLKRKVKQPLVVLGAYERGAVSRWLKKSMADVLLKNIAVPIFIAHK